MEFREEIYDNNETLTKIENKVDILVDQQIMKEKNIAQKVLNDEGILILCNDSENDDGAETWQDIQ